MRSLLFGDYMNADAEGEDRMYEEVRSIQDFTDITHQSLEEYNQTHKTQMNLVVFRFTISTFNDHLINFVSFSDICWSIFLGFHEY